MKMCYLGLMCLGLVLAGCGDTQKTAGNPGGLPQGGPAGKGAGGKGPPGGGNPGGPIGSHFNADEIFTQHDKNKDGKLTGDEISGPLQTNLALLDADKDGALTLAELRDGAAKMFEAQAPKKKEPPKKNESPKTNDDPSPKKN